MEWSRALGGDYRQLYNGNISSMAVNIEKLGNPLLYNYQYDQLNRIVAMDAWQKGANWGSLTPRNDFQERISYDANGNILGYKRNGNNTFAGKPLGMDSLNYSYVMGTNRLDHVSDNVPAGNYTEDIDNQTAGNYDYDAIGNLVKDNAEGITSISWTVYGKIRQIVKGDSVVISYTYDPSGNRISKAIIKSGSTDTARTWYVRDAQGNVMSVYEAGKPSVNEGHLTQSELHLYGSSRIGLLRRSFDVAEEYNPADTTMSLLGIGLSNNFGRGNKLFELSNHLENVLVTLNDKKLGVSSNNNTIDYFNPQVVSAQDYYPFGMLQVGRVFNTSEYRFGFQGQMTDNEVKGEGNQIDFGFRVHDPRIGKFLSIDPLSQKYPQYSPYHFSSNQPIHARELEGLESEFDLTIPNSPGEVDLNHWKLNTQHKNPNGMSWVDVHGNKLFFDKAQFDKNGKPLDGWKGVDHWHFENAEGQRFNADGVPNKSAKGQATHLRPGTQTKIKIPSTVIAAAEEGIAATNAVAKGVEESAVSKFNGKVGGAMVILDVTASFFGIATGDPDALINWFGTGQIGELKRGNIGGENGNYYMILREETKEWTENGVKYKEVTRVGQNYLHKGLTKDKKFVGADPVGGEIHQTQSYKNGKEIKTGGLQKII